MAQSSVPLIVHLNENIEYFQTLLQNQHNEPLFYFRVKLVNNSKNNTFTLVDKVVGIGRSMMYLFWADQDNKNNKKKQPIDVDRVESSQQKISLSKFDHFSVVPNTDPQFMSYIKSIMMNAGKLSIPDEACMVFLQSVKDFEAQLFILESFEKGLELVYCLQLVRSLRQYEQLMQKYTPSQNPRLSVQTLSSNLKLALMATNIEFGYLHCSPQNFGYNCPTQYEEAQQKAQFKIYDELLNWIIKSNQSRDEKYQFGQKLTVKIQFKLVDQDSREYARRFLQPVQRLVQKLFIQRCELKDDLFESLMTDLREESNKTRGIGKIVGNVPEDRVLCNLTHLDLSWNRLTDNFFHGLYRQIYEGNTEKSHNKVSSGVGFGTSPLFPCLTHLNLCHNYIQLFSLQTQNKLVSVLQVLSGFTLEQLDLSHNQIKSLQFFQKYFLMAEGGQMPVEFIDLKGNKGISERKKEAFVLGYMEKEQKGGALGFVIELGSLGTSNGGNADCIAAYMGKLSHYYKTHSFERSYRSNQRMQNDEDGSSFINDHFSSILRNYGIQSSPINPTNTSSNSLPVTLSLSASHISPSQQQPTQPEPIRSSQLQDRRSSLSPSTSLIQPLSQQQLLQNFGKLFYLKDYKQLQDYKVELQKGYGMTGQVLSQIFSKQYSTKKYEEKRITQLLEQVVNFVDNTNGDSNRGELQHIVNSKLDQLVGIIRRKGLQGQAPQFLIYLKHLRDQCITKYLSSPSTYQALNLQNSNLHNLSVNYPMVYSQEQKASEDSSFLKEDYQKLAYAEEEELLKLFWENKKAAEKIFNEKLYDRLRWVLVGKISISDLTDTLVKELKLVSCRLIRCYHRLITTHNNTSLVITKQKLTSPYTIPSTQTLVLNQNLPYITTYPFPSPCTSLEQLSTSPSPISQLPCPQAHLPALTQFIHIINNFITFLYYTPDQISEQSVTYINYIINYLNELSLDSFQDIQFKEALVEELYLRIMVYRPEQKLKKGLLLNVIEYFTLRIICRTDLEKYLLGYLLENQCKQDIDNSHIALNTLIKGKDKKLSNKSSSSEQVYKNILTKQSKINWTIPPQFLLHSINNKNSLTIYFSLDSEPLLSPGQLIQFSHCHQSMTIGELVQQLLFSESNNITNQLLLQRRSRGLGNEVSQEELNKYWLFSKLVKGHNKLEYYRPYESFKYVGEIISEEFEQKDKVVLYLRKAIRSQNMCNKSYISYELDQNELLGLFNQTVHSLNLSIEILSKTLPLQMINIPNTNNSQQVYQTVYSHMIYIYYLQSLPSSYGQLSEQEQQEKNESLLHEIIERLLSQSHFSEGQELTPIVVNFKTFQIEEKLSIISRVKEMMRSQQMSRISKNQKPEGRKDKSKSHGRESISDRIIEFINLVGDLGHAQLLMIGQNKVAVINNRVIAIAQVLYHTNELNEIINTHLKPIFSSKLSQILDIKIHNDNPTTCSIVLTKMNLTAQSSSLQNFQLSSQEPYSILCLYNLFVSIHKNLVSFDNKLLYTMQQNGLGHSSQKRSSLTLTQSNANPQSSSPKNSKPVYAIDQAFISYKIARNKENEHFEQFERQKLFKSSQLVHVENVSTSQVVTLANKSEEILLETKSKNQAQSQLIIGNVQEEEQVYSRKSSKRSMGNREESNQQRSRQSLHSNRQSIKPNNSQKSLQQNPSQKSIPNSQPEPLPPFIQSQLPKSTSRKVIEPPSQIPAEQIITQINQQSPPSQSPSIDLNQIQKPQLQLVVTNQQRKSRKQMPKRRSSRDKDK